MGVKGTLRDTLRHFGIDVALVLAAMVFAYLLVFRLPFTPLLNESDHHMFLYEGMRLLDGDVMYRDFFQFTFPGCQTWYWLMFAIFGLKYWILPATIVIIAGASAAVCLAVSRAVIGGRLYVVPTILLVFFGFRWDGIDGTHRMFSPIFVMLAVAILLRGKDRFSLILAGSSCAAASFFTQQRGFYALVAISVFLVIDSLKTDKKIAESLGAILTICVTFLLVMAALSGYFVVAAGPRDFFSATLEYPAKYYHYAVYNNFGILAIDLKHTLAITDISSAIAAADSIFYLFVTPAGYIALWFLFLINRKTLDWARWRAIALVAFVGVSLTFTITAPNTSRLFQVAMPGLIVFVWLLAYAAESERPLFANIPKALAAFSALVVLLSVIQVVRVQSIAYQMLETPCGNLAYNPSPIIDKRYKWLIERTKPGVVVFETYQPYIYFPLLLRNPTKYGQIWDSDYTRPEHVADTIADLAAKRPRYILWNNDYNKPPETRSAGDHTAPLADYLQQNYRPASDVIDNTEGHIQIWELK